MAYLSQTDDQRKQQAQAQGQPPAATTGSGGGAAFGGYGAQAPAGGGGAQAPKAASGPSGTGYTNLQSYLSLNQGAGQQMANHLASTANTANANATNAYNNTSAAFNQQVQAGTVGANEGRRGDVPDASAAALADAQARSQQQYAGPASWGDAQTQQYAAAQTEAQKQAGRLGSQEGIGLGLQDAYGKGKAYSTGARGLDVFLTNGAGGAQLKQASSGYDALQKYLGGAGTRANEAIAAGTQNSDNANAGWAQQATDIQSAQAAARAAQQRADAGDRLDPNGSNTRINQNQANRPRDRGLPQTGNNYAWGSGGGRTP